MLASSKKTKEPWETHRSPVHQCLRNTVLWFQLQRNESLARNWSEVLPMLRQNGASDVSASSTLRQTSLPMDSSTIQHSTTSDACLPPQLRLVSITAQEYDEKLSQLKDRLRRWKGGKASLALGCFSLLLVLCFLVAYLTPGFWSSPLFHNPGYIAAIAVLVLLILTALVRFIRRERQRLERDVEDLYRPWRGRGVHVTMKQVASIGNEVYISRNGTPRQRQSSKSNCFCVVINVVTDEEGGDTMSVETVMTDDSR